MGAAPSGLTAKDPVESVPHEGPIDSSHGALSNGGGVMAGLLDQLFADAIFDA